MVKIKTENYKSNPRQQFFLLNALFIILCPENSKKRKGEKKVKDSLSIFVGKSTL